MDLTLTFLPLIIIAYLLFQYFHVISGLMNNNNLSSNEKWKWSLIILCFPIVGTLLFLNFLKKDR